MRWCSSFCVRSGLGGPDNNLRIGFSAGSTGSYTLNAGDLGVADSLTIGHNGTGTFTMNGGTISRAGYMTVGNNPGANGTFNMHGGTVNRDFGDFEVGDEAVGVANIDGGTFNTPGGGWRFSIGNRPLGTGTANVSGNAVYKARKTAVQYQVSANGSMQFNGLKTPLFGSSSATESLRTLITQPRTHALENEYNSDTRRTLDPNEALT